MTKMECPCSKDCPDRNAKCHMKGNCPHNWDKWYEEHEKEKQLIRAYKEERQAPVTAAKEKRHFNWVKYGDRNTRR